MIPPIRQGLAVRPAEYGAFLGFSALTLLALFTALAMDWYFLLLLPAALLLTWLLVVDVRLVFFLLLACIPLSTEVALPNGLGTDLPSEPLMWLLTATVGLFALRHGWRHPLFQWRHPLSLLLFLHLGWIAFTALVSTDPLVSWKYFLAKTWYVLPFFGLSAYLIRRPQDLERVFWFVFIPLTCTIGVVWFRHAPHQFSFAEVNYVLSPFYRNHVIYASIMAVFFPFLWFVRGWQPRGSLKRWMLNLAVPLYLTAIYLAYTRAAYVALLVAVGAQVVIHFRLTRLVLTVLVGVALGTMVFLLSGNRYLDYAPNYERTVTHYDFNNLIEATYQLEDISTMERLYRWVAGGFMVMERPWTGFGPGTFYPAYKSYTVSSFKTYVSDNPERSGIHNYYLMMLVEQGIPGLLLFAGLVVVALLTGERIYHRLAGSRDRQMVLIAVHTLIIILILSLINDLLETDKIGPFFFIALAVLVNLDGRRPSGPDD